MNNVIEMLPQDKRELLQGLENLSEQVRNGTVVAYFVIGIGPHDSLHPMWGACGPGVSVCRGLGAIEALSRRFANEIKWNWNDD
jgi:hypothetical protein